MLCCNRLRKLVTLGIIKEVFLNNDHKGPLEGLGRPIHEPPGHKPLQPVEEVPELWMNVSVPVMTPGLSITNI